MSSSGCCINKERFSIIEVQQNPSFELEYQNTVIRLQVKRGQSLNSQDKGLIQTESDSFLKNVFTGWQRMMFSISWPLINYNLHKNLQLFLRWYAPKLIDNNKDSFNVAKVLTTQLIKSTSWQTWASIKLDPFYKIKHKLNQSNFLNINSPWNFWGA